ncbi:MAG: acyl-CoA dehydrogenase family protein [Chloroflexota bacterium]
MSLMAKLVELGQEAEQRRAEIEAARVLPDDLVQKLKETAVLKLWVAQKYGGQQAPVSALTNAVQTLAYYEGSLAWVAMVTGTGALISGYLDEANGEAIFGRWDAMTGGWAAPAGKAKRVEGGLRVTGRWGWGSGTTHCTTVAGGVMILAEGEKPRPALACFESEDVVWHDNWHVNGLQGTASGDYEVVDCFVPDGRWLPFPLQKAAVDSPLYRVSFYGALAAGVASVALGLAQRALDEVRQLGLTKKPAMARRTLSEKPIVQYQLAEATARYEAANAFLAAAIAENWTAAQQTIPLAETKNRLRMAATHAVTEAAQVVDWAYKTGGGSTIWNGVKLQELQRDMQIVTQHGLIAPSNYEMVGRVAFGLPFNEWLL